MRVECFDEELEVFEPDEFDSFEMLSIKSLDFVDGVVESEVFVYFPESDGVLASGDGELVDGQEDYGEKGGCEEGEGGDD